MYTTGYPPGQMCHRHSLVYTDICRYSLARGGLSVALQLRLLAKEVQRGGQLIIDYPSKKKAVPASVRCAYAHHRVADRKKNTTWFIVSDFPAAKLQALTVLAKTEGPIVRAYNAHRFASKAGRPIAASHWRQTAKYSAPLLTYTHRLLNIQTITA